MLTLYVWNTPNGYKVPILLEELGLEYSLVPINITKGAQKTPEYLALNPNNKIPTLVDSEGEGGPLTIFESGAILMYLAEKYKKFLPTETKEKYAVIEWLMFQMAGVGPMFGQATHFVQYAPEKIPYAIERYKSEAARLCAVMDKLLGEAAYLGGEYSIADMATWPWIASAKKRETIALSTYPNLSRWFKDIENRPAVKRAIEKTNAVSK